MGFDNRNVFSLARFKQDTQDFTSLPAPRRWGMQISYPAYVAYVLFLRTPWRRLIGPRLSEDKSNAMLYFAPPLRDEHVRNCRVFGDRHNMLLSFEKHRKWAEVGTFEGKFAREIFDRCQPSELHVIDISMEHARTHNHISELEAGVKFHEGDSATILATFPDAYFDYIYIDANHSLFDVARDVDQATKKLKSDGTLIFNDYIFISHADLTVYGIVPVVNALCNDEGWEFSAFALHYQMYCDVALRRRTP
jgi:predicted O-methyltransferase YrrM